MTVGSLHCVSGGKRQGSRLLASMAEGGGKAKGGEVTGKGFSA